MDMTKTASGRFSGSPKSRHARGCTRRASSDCADAELLARIAMADKASMHELYRRHRLAILRFVRRFLRNESIVEDVVNEVFVDVWRSASCFEGRSQVWTWLAAIARNKALAAMHRRAAVSLDWRVAMSLEDPDDDPERVLEKSERASIVRDCLKQLSPAHREVIDLIYYRGSKIDDVAATIGIPRNTVKTRMHYARKELGQLLGARGITTVLDR
jgi:RNA polymerase sigma-70 factor (ECF subfamily)